VSVWNLRTHRRAAPDLRFSADGVVNAVAFSPDSRRVVAGSNSGRVDAWRIADGSRLWTSNTGANVNGVEWARGDTVVAGNGLSQLLRIRASTGRVIGSPTAAGVGEISSTEVSADSRLVAVGGAKGSVAVVDAASGERLYLFPGRPGRVTGSAFLSSKVLISVDEGGDVVLRHLDPAWWKQRACAEAARALTPEEQRTYLPGGQLAVC
jgi:WD40 repeat protein